MIVVLILGIVAIIYGFIEYTKIETNTLYLEDYINNKEIPENAKNSTILFVSDFQFDLPFGLFNHRALKRVIDTIKSINPDVLVLGGDYVDSGNYSKDTIFDSLSQVGIDTIAILGNHDCKYNMKAKSVERVSQFAKLLINDSYDTLGLKFYGLDDYVGKPNLYPNLDARNINIVLSHRPDAFYDIKSDFDLMLSGHTHGGMITFLGRFAPIPHNGYGQKLVRGLVKEGSKTIYVSRGVGGNIFGLPIRIFSKPEVVLLKLKK